MSRFYTWLEIDVKFNLNIYDLYAPCNLFSLIHTSYHLLSLLIESQLLSVCLVSSYKVMWNFYLGVNSLHVVIRVANYFDWNIRTLWWRIEVGGEVWGGYCFLPRKLLEFSILKWLILVASEVPSSLQRMASLIHRLPGIIGLCAQKWVPGRWLLKMCLTMASFEIFFSHV